MEAISRRPTWRKSSYSSSQGDHCVELAGLNGTIGIRDSKDPHGPQLHITRDTLRTLLTNLKR